MLVPLTADEGSNRAWAMIEMQGELERKDGGTLDEAFDVGTLSVSSTVSARAVAGGPASKHPRTARAACRWHVDQCLKMQQKDGRRHQMLAT